MKRRVVSFITVLALCLGLLPTQALAVWEEDAAWEEDVRGPSDILEPDAGEWDTEEPDAGEPDTEGPDAGEWDTEEPDAGEPDAEEPDAGEQGVWRPDAAGAPAVFANGGISTIAGSGFSLVGDEYPDGTLTVSYALTFDTAGYNYTVESETAIRVTGTGNLTVKNSGGKTSTIRSQNGAGMEVQSGGSLYVDGANVEVTGTSYGLDVSSGTTVQLSSGAYSGSRGAIRTAAGTAASYAALLKSGYAYFDAGGSPVALADVGGRTSVRVGACTDHAYDLTADPGATTHSGTCKYCGVTVTGEFCTFDFGTNDTAECSDCHGHTLKIAVDAAGSLVYDGETKPAGISVSFELDGSPITMAEGTNYTVSYTPRTDVGEITVTVTGKTYGGTPYTKTFRVIQAQPVIEWVDPPASMSIEKDYNRQPAGGAVLPGVRIRMDPSSTKDWSELLPWKYYYKLSTEDDSAYAPGRPTDAGTYDVIARLPAALNYEQADTPPLTLTIRKINPIETYPAAVKRIYNGKAQTLVDGGKLCDLAVQDGVAIQFRVGEDGRYADELPTAVNAGKYVVYYRVGESKNYLEVVTEGVTEEDTVGTSGRIKKMPVQAEIEPMVLTPVIELAYYTVLYDGGKKMPAVDAVRESVDGTVLPKSEYRVVYSSKEQLTAEDIAALGGEDFEKVGEDSFENGDLIKAGKKYVHIVDKEGGNYTVNGTQAYEITPSDQDALTIVDKPAGDVIYGDSFRLSTTGGSGNGTVRWSVIAAEDAQGNKIEPENFHEMATVDASGQVTVRGVGEITVEARKSDANDDGTSGDHKDATAEWTFTAKPKHVTATVTAASKTYDSKLTATVTAEVAPGEYAFSKDAGSIGIGGLTGTFDSANAGRDKTVTVDTSGAKITGGDAVIAGEEDAADQEGKKYVYIVTVPAAPVTADINKVVALIKTPPTLVTGPLTYDGTPQHLLAPDGSGGRKGAVPNNAKNITVEYALSEDGPWSAAYPTAKDAGEYEVWYRAQETENYTAIAPVKADHKVEIKAKPVVPYIILDPDPDPDKDTAGFYIYDGRPKEPAVKVMEADENGAPIANSEIPGAEYTVTYRNNVAAGEAAVIVTPGGNYKFLDKDGYAIRSVEKPFTIRPDNPAVVTKAPESRAPLVYNAALQYLVTAGAAEGGKMVYYTEKLADAVNGGDPVPPDLLEDGEYPYSPYDESLPREMAAGEYVVFYMAAGDSNHSNSKPDYLFVTIAPKTLVNPTIELRDKTSSSENDFTTVYTTQYVAGQKAEPEVRVLDSENGKVVATSEYSVTYTNNATAGTATVHIRNRTGNYIVNATATFEIIQGKAAFVVGKEPKAVSGLVYKGRPLELITRGTPTVGTALYSLNGGPYTTEVPTATEPGPYVVRAMIRGDNNYADLNPAVIMDGGNEYIEIGVNIVTNPAVKVSPTKVPYTGSVQRPETVTVWDNDGDEIGTGAYTVQYYKTGVETPTADVGVYDVRLTTTKAQYYQFKYEDPAEGETPPEKPTFEIYAVDQDPLQITGQPSGAVYYGDTLRLGTTGGSGGGAVSWTVEAGENTVLRQIDDSSEFRVIGVGAFTVKATKAASANYGATSDSWTFSAQKKPVTATVTAANKVYDGDNKADLTVIVPDINGTGITVTEGVTGAFADPDVGDGKTVKITVTETAVKGTGGDAAKLSCYAVNYLVPVTANITPKPLDIPKVKANVKTEAGEGVSAVPLEYSGSEQPLVVDTTGTIADENTANSDPVGKVVYSTDGSTFSEGIPQGLNAGKYTVWYKAKSLDKNHTDSETKSVPVIIAPMNVTVVVDISHDSYPYNGEEQTPYVTVKYQVGVGADGAEYVIPAGNYTVTYQPHTPREVGDYTVVVTAKSDGNYKFTEDSSNTFKIVDAGQAPFSIVAASTNVRYGDTFQLTATGGSGNGAVTWTIPEAYKDIAKLEPGTGEVTVVTVVGVGTGSFTVKAKKAGGGGYADSAEAAIQFTVKPRPAAPKVHVSDKVWDGGKDASNITVEWDWVDSDRDALKDKIAVTGAFETDYVEDNKPVTVTIKPDASVSAITANYIIPATVPATASITPAATSLDGITVSANSLTYDGALKELVTATGGTSTGGNAVTVTGNAVTVDGKPVGVLVYSLDGNTYTTGIPQAKDAGKYTVSYKVRGDRNHYDSPEEKSVKVTIGELAVVDPVIEMSPDEFIYDGQPKQATTVTVKNEAGTITVPSEEYTVRYDNNTAAADKDAATAPTLTVELKPNSNYVFKNSTDNSTFTLTTKTFTITAGKAGLIKAPEPVDRTYDGSVQPLVTGGEAAAGAHLEYYLQEDTVGYTRAVPTAANAGTYHVYYKVVADNSSANYTETDPVLVIVTIAPKTVDNPAITLAETANGTYTDTYSVPFSNVEQRPYVTVKDGDDTIPSTEYTVTYDNNLNAGTAKVILIDNDEGNYIVSGSRTFTITKAQAKFTTDPTAKTNLVYNGKPQELIDRGAADFGTVLYSVNNSEYTTETPTGLEKGEYKVYAKIEGTNNYEGVDATKPIVANSGDTGITIGVNGITGPTSTVDVDPATTPYTGSVQVPAIKIWDKKDNHLIAPDAYTVKYYKLDENGDASDTETSPRDVGKYEIRFISNNTNHYTFTFDPWPRFEITKPEEERLEITGKPVGDVYYGDVLRLGTTGSSEGGTVTWTSTDDTDKKILQNVGNGEFRVIGVGSVTITATKAASDNHNAVSATWPFVVQAKPVRAEVTAANKDYDGDRTAYLTVTIPGTAVQGVTAYADGSKIKGTFASANVGTGIAVDIAGIDFDNLGITGRGNYAISNPTDAVTANITPKPLDRPAVTEKTGLEYIGPEEAKAQGVTQAQALVTGPTEIKEGDKVVGQVVYALGDGSYGDDIPTGLNAGRYTVRYKAVSLDSNHSDSGEKTVTVVIAPMNVTAVVDISPESYPYNGEERTPYVTVKYQVGVGADGAEYVIPADNYTVTYQPHTPKEVGDYTVVVTAKSDGNYIFKEDRSKTFKIEPVGQASLSIVAASTTVVYGETFQLTTTGGSGTGTVKWTVTSGSDTAKLSAATGEVIQVTVKGTESFTIRAEKENDSNHSGTNNTNSVVFTVNKRPVGVTVTAKDKVYNGNKVAEVTAAVNSADLVFGDQITLTAMGAFDTEYVWDNKTVTVTIGVEDASKSIAANYDIPPTARTTANITPASIATANIPTVTGATGLTYTGGQQKLITAPASNEVTVGTETVGTLVYSLDGNDYSQNIPQAKDVDDYTVRYKVKGDMNHFDSEVQSVKVSIGKCVVLDPVIQLSSASYIYDGQPKQPTVTVKYKDKDGNDQVLPSDAYSVGYSNNVNPAKATDQNPPTVTVTLKMGSSYELWKTGDNNVAQPVTSETKTFTITADLGVATAPQAINRTYDAVERPLVTAGTATAGGHLEYRWDEDPGSGAYSQNIPKATNAGIYHVYYKVVSDEDSTKTTAEVLVTVNIDPKVVNSPTIVLQTGYDYQYKGTPWTPTVTVMDSNGTTPIGTPAATSQGNDEYTVKYYNNTNAGMATVVIENKSGGNYVVNGSTTFEIKKVQAKFTTNPTAVSGLAYDGRPQELITAGTPDGGTAVYNVNDGAYSTAIPTGTNRGNYKVNAMVRGDGNHTDSTPVPITESGKTVITIGVNEVENPIVVLSQGKFPFDGYEHRPTVTLYDDNSHVIPADQYEVKYPGDNKAVGTHKIQITFNTTGNYSFKNQTDSQKGIENGTLTVTFEIFKEQTWLAIIDKPSVVYFGDTIQLSTAGSAGEGTVEWTVETVTDTDKTSDQGTAAKGASAGQFVITKAGYITVTATKTFTDSNYANAKDTWTFLALPKPVTAKVTVADKPYDGQKDNAPLTVTVPGINGDIPAVYTGSKGTYASADAGEGILVTFTIDKTKVNFEDIANYDITYPSQATGNITKVAIPSDAIPTVQLKTPQTYTGKPLPLVDGSDNSQVTAGGQTVGTLVYSVNGGAYSADIPKATNAGKYTISYMVKGDKNHDDSGQTKLGTQAVIDPIRVSGAEAVCEPATFPYDGNEKMPYVNVKVTYTENGKDEVLPSNEYTVTPPPGPHVNIAAYTVTVESKGNYEFQSSDGSNLTSLTATFKIVGADQAPFAITSRGPDVYYGQSFSLTATGGSGTGEVKWELDDNSTGVASLANGVVTVLKGSGSFTVTGYREAKGAYGESYKDSVTFTAHPASITPTVTVKDQIWDGNTAVLDENLIVTWSWVSDADRNALEDGVKVLGTYGGSDAGEQQVTFSIDKSGLDADAGAVAANYDFAAPAPVRAVITKAPIASGDIPAVTAKPKLTYTGGAQTLVTPPSADGKVTAGGKTVGTLFYSTDGNSYSSNIPEAVKAGGYDVWYKVQGDGNHKDSEPQKVVTAGETYSVTIAKATPTVASKPAASAVNKGEPLRKSTLTGGEMRYNQNQVKVPGAFAWKGPDAVPDGERTYTVIFTPEDTDNFHIVEIQVEIKVNADPDTGGGDIPGDRPGVAGQSEPAAPAAPAPSAGAQPSESFMVPASVEDGTAVAAVGAEDSDRLVALAGGSKTVVIAPEIPAGVTKAEISIPAETMGRLGNETEAALTISTPIAGVTIPNDVLEALAAGGTVSVAAEQVGNTLVLSLTAGGEDVGEVPGLTLTVPAEDAGPGTVAVLVHEDGTRETLRWSVAEDGTVRVPLSGSATVEIVDNSKSFADVPAESWASDAVAFASAHELFTGTSETTFSPDQSMSRGMLATVLYNLEGRPEQSPTGTFSDVSDEAWYAPGVSWAAENGIVGGYDDGQFGPDDSITREQFAVMLWRYAGEPTAAAETLALTFTDMDAASDYALEALRWAAANGILNGYGDGQLDPVGLATRAQAAKMLQSFIESL